MGDLDSEVSTLVGSDGVAAGPSASATPKPSPSSPLAFKSTLTESSPPKDPADIPAADTFSEVDDQDQTAIIWGRTFSGQDFQVPPTQDIIESLFYPSEPQTVFEWTILVILAIEVFVFITGTTQPTTDFNRTAFMMLFGFWRFMLDVVLGVMLKLQSSSQFLVRWVKRKNLGGRPSSRRGPWTEYLVGELKKKIGVDDVAYDELPIEYITWTLFRGFVDIILINDFVCFFFFAASHVDFAPDVPFTWHDYLRFFASLLMLGFNFWVKLDVRRVIKDFAWYRQAGFWRIMYNWVLGLILHLQSTNKFWSRHFIKYGETTKEAFHQWKIFFNLSQSMTYITFFICACRLYTVPENWYHGIVLLKHIIAAILILLHIGTALSIHKALGDFGWFYGDFFIDSLRDANTLNYTGIYRFLNHPNAWAATASAWGITMVCGSWPLMWLTVFGQISNWMFVRYVELPHMHRRYGPKVRARQDAGMEKALREGVEKIEGQAKDVVDRVVKGLDTRWRKIKRLRRVMSWEGARSWDADDSEQEDEDDRTSSHGEEDDDEDFDEAPSYFKARPTSESRALKREPEEESTSSGSEMLDEPLDGLRKRRGSKERPNLPYRMPQSRSSFSETMREAVKKTKPRVNKIVHDAKMIVTKRVERLASVTQRSPSPLLPIHLYSLTFPSAPKHSPLQQTFVQGRDAGPIVFRLGEPIPIQFTCARETVKRRDWIGIYGAGHNLSTEITTSRNNLWIFVTNAWHREDDDVTTPLMRKITQPIPSPSDDTPPASPTTDGPELAVDDNPAGRKRKGPAAKVKTTILLGETPVTVRQSEEDEGLRIVTGIVVFKRSRLPWRVGAYEARYHLDSGYSVLAVSHVFEIVVEEFDWEEEGGPGMPSVFERVEETLRALVERCVDVDVGIGDRRLGVDEDVITRCKVGEDTPDAASFAKYKEEVTQRIVYGIRQIFGIEFSWKICEAREALKITAAP
ncbi:phosphatidylethanolamine N-methyltransferase [Irineochytrium annulatum]|nr:phosphatidylethanolamine N-methyltransferase [Irineochytrium annulatum]